MLIFPDVNVANITDTLLMRLGGARAIGPILVRITKAVYVLRRGSDVSDSVYRR